MYYWNVMYLCEKQLRDVNPKDVLSNGLFRKCNTYKGGGGYDKFPQIYQNRFGVENELNNQFVVQLKGCPLNCKYCYVTREGVNGEDYEEVTTQRLMLEFANSGCKVFHLMGGAPALYIHDWYRILDMLPEDAVFHSDILCLEYLFPEFVIRDLTKYKRFLCAVSIKGYGGAEFKANTGVDFNTVMFWKNFDMLVQYKFPFYLTYTGMPDASIQVFEAEIKRRYPNDYEWILRDAFSIDIVHYKALD